MQRLKKLIVVFFFMIVIFLTWQYLLLTKKPKDLLESSNTKSIEQVVSAKIAAVDRSISDKSLEQNSEYGSDKFNTIISLYRLIQQTGNRCEGRLAELLTQGVINDRYGLELREGESIVDILNSLPFEVYISQVNNFISETSKSLPSFTEFEQKKLFDEIEKKEFFYGNTNCSVEKMQIIWMNIASLPMKQKKEAFNETISTLCRLTKNELSFTWLRGYLETLLSFIDSKLIDVEYKPYLNELYSEFLDYTDDFEQEDYEQFEVLQKANNDEAMKSKFLKRLFDLYSNRSHIVNRLRDQINEVVCQLRADVESN